MTSARELGSTRCRVDGYQLSQYRKALGLNMVGDRELPAPAVVPFNPAIEDDFAVLAEAALDTARTLALGIDVEVLAVVREGDLLDAVSLLVRDEVQGASRYVDIETSFRRDGELVRRWTLHLLERGPAS